MKKLEQEKIDDDMWAQGLYFYNAIQTALAEFGAGLSGKHSKAKYLEKSLHQIHEEKMLHEQGLEKEYKYLSNEERQKAEQIRQQYSHISGAGVNVPQDHSMPGFSSQAWDKARYKLNQDGQDHKIMNKGIFFLGELC